MNDLGKRTCPQLQVQIIPSLSGASQGPSLTQIVGLSQENYVLKENSYKKDRWDKFQIVGSLAIPVTIALFGFLLGQGLERGQLQAKYVEIAVGIIKDDQESVAMNRWALSILDKSSPIAIPPDLEKSLLNLELEHPQYRTTNAFGDGMPILEFSSEMQTSVKAFHYVRIDRRLVAETPSTISIDAGGHEIVWQDTDGNVVCSYQSIFQSWKYSLSCNEKTGEVSVKVPAAKAKLN